MTLEIDWSKYRKLNPIGEQQLDRPNNMAAEIKDIDSRIAGLKEELKEANSYKQRLRSKACRKELEEANTSRHRLRRNAYFEVTDVERGTSPTERHKILLVANLRARVPNDRENDAFACVVFKGESVPWEPSSTFPT